MGNRIVVFAVTTAQSLILLGSIPERMKHRGWEVHVVSGTALTGADSRLSGVTYHTVPMKRRPSFLDIHSLVRWWQLIGKLRPTLVSVGTPKAALLALLVSYLRGVPTRVYHLRGLRLETYGYPFRLILWFFEFLCSSSSTHILAVSPSLRELYIRLRLSPAEKVRIIGLGSSRGVDTKHFLPSSPTINPPPIADSPKRPGRLVIGFVGRLSVDKGAQIILDCRRNLVSEGIDHDFLVVGGKDEIGTDLLRQIAETGRYPILVGSVQDVAPYYRMMDILLLPTYREGLPNVVLEASSCSVPVVSTQATGAKDSIVDGKSGILVPVGDSSGFCQAVVDLAKNQDLRIRMGSFGRGWVQRNFEKEKVESAHADFLEWVSGQDPSLSNLQPKE